MSTLTNKIETGAKEIKGGIASKMADTAEYVAPSSSKDAPMSTDTLDQSMLDQTKSYATAAATDVAKKAVGVEPEKKPSLSSDINSTSADIKASAKKQVGKTISSTDEAKSDVPETASKKEGNILAKVGHEAEKLADKIVGSVDKLLHKSKKGKTATISSAGGGGEEKVEEGEGTQSAGQSTDTTPEKKSHHTWQESLGKKIHDVSEAILHPSKKVKKGASDASATDAASKAEPGSGIV